MGAISLAAATVMPRALPWREKDNQPRHGTVPIMEDSSLINARELAKSSASQGQRA
jgi:hypothetical protein